MKNLICCLSTYLILGSAVAKPVYLLYNGNKKYIQNAVNKANEILATPSFYDEIRKVKKFDNTTLSGNEIAEIMEKAHQQINVSTYWYLNPFHPKRCVDAGTNDSVTIKLNTRCFSATLAESVNTLIHETVHAIDWLDGKQDFTHDGNASNGQENTTPWVIGAIAERMAQ